MMTGEMIKWLKANLTLEMDTSSEYTGRSEGPLYRDYHTITLTLEGDTIGSVTFSIGE